MTKDEALRLALEALGWTDEWRPQGLKEEALNAIKAALEAKDEPVAFFDWYDNAHWGNEDFKEGCHRAWNAAIKYTAKTNQEAKDEPWEKFCDSNCVWTDHHPDCKLAKDEPVALAWAEGYQMGIADERTSEANIGIAGFDAKVEPARENPYVTTPPQRKPMTNDEIVAEYDKFKADKEAKDEPCCYGGIAHDCHAGSGCRIAERLKAALEAKDEPVAWEVYVEEVNNGYLVDSLDDPQLIDDCTNHNAVVTPLYTTPPQRTWVGLTADEYAELTEEYGPFPINQIEAKLKEKNT